MHDRAGDTARRYVGQLELDLALAPPLGRTPNIACPPSGSRLGGPLRNPCDPQLVGAGEDDEGRGAVFMVLGESGPPVVCLLDGEIV